MKISCLFLFSILILSVSVYAQEKTDTNTTPPVTIEQPQPTITEPVVPPAEPTAQQKIDYFTDWAKDNPVLAEELTKIYVKHPDWRGAIWGDETKMQWILDNSDDHPMAALSLMEWADKHPKAAEWLWKHPKIAKRAVIEARAHERAKRFVKSHPHMARWIANHPHAARKIAREIRQERRQQKIQQPGAGK